MTRIDVIFLAAGRGSRAGEVKQYADLCGTPVIIRAVLPFQQLPYVGRKYVAVHPQDFDQAARLFAEHQISDFQLVVGGATRQDSVRHALQHVQTERVLTHNAVLPFVTPDMIDDVVREDHPCVTTVTPLQISLCRGHEFAEHMVNREGLQIINTPQVFRTEIFRDCHRRAEAEGFAAMTDCELMMHYGHPVRFIPGRPENFKITTPLDMVLARAVAKTAPRGDW